MGISRAQSLRVMGAGDPILRTPSIVVVNRSLVILFENIQRIAVMVLHADSAKDGSYGAGGAALFPDHLAHIRGCNPEPKDRTFFPFHCLNFNCRGNINKCARDLGNQFPHVIGSVCRLIHHCPPMGRHRSFNLPGLPRILP
jgi:hypothetical protein